MVDDRTVEAIRAMVTALAEPRTPPPDALNRIASSASSAWRRKRMTRGAALAAVVLVTAALLEMVPRLADSGPTSSNSERPVLISARIHGFGVEMTTAFPTDRLLVRGSYLVDGQSSKIDFYNDDTGVDASFESLAVGARDRLSFFGSLYPSCENGWGWPSAMVTSRLPDGRTVIERFEFDSASRQTYRVEREWWCSAPAHAAIMESGHGAKGRASFGMDVDNTTDHPITVVSAHLRYGETNWSRSSVTVPPRGRAQLFVHATGYHGGPKPWNRGLLTANGVSFEPAHY
jgi:hypothetical protein